MQTETTAAVALSKTAALTLLLLVLESATHLHPPNPIQQHPTQKYKFTFASTYLR
jgi:hypothetical protein